MGAETDYFGDIILTGRYVDGFVEAALRENLVGAGRCEPTPALAKPRASRLKKRCLELSLLFDRVHLRNCHPDISIPSLEKEGRITIESRKIDRAGQFLEAHHEDTDNAFHEYRYFLRDVYYLKPFILDEFLGVRAHPAWEHLEEYLGVPPRKLYSTMFELMGAEFLSIATDEDQELFEGTYLQNIPSKSVLSDLLDIVTGDSRDFSDGIGFFFNVALVLGDSLLSVLEESADRRCVVAWGASPKSKAQSQVKSRPDAYQIGRAFRIVRCALREEGLVFPEVENFSQVARLRNDKRLHDFRTVVGAFASELAGGDTTTAAKIKDDVKKANRALAKVGRCRKIGELVTFFSLPAFVADVLITGGIASLSTVFIGVGTTAYSKLQERRHRWVMFGQT